MSETELLAADREVPDLAIKALAEASRKARESGQTLVLARDGQLLQIGLPGTVVLKQLPPRMRVAVRVKRAKA
jgi:hypothetical protein